MVRQSVSSTDIKSIGYENGVLEIEFIKGGIYQYPNVPRYHCEYMITHSHPGTYFHKEIKPYYPPRR
jgi:hypothetical protein